MQRNECVEYGRAGHRQSLSTILSGRLHDGGRPRRSGFRRGHHARRECQIEPEQTERHPVPCRNGDR